jgi:hypothetical protein
VERKRMTLFLSFIVNKLLNNIVTLAF